MHPEADEACNGVDDDCDGSLDEESCDSGPDDSGQTDDEEGCGCHAAGRGGSPATAFLLLALATLRRRRD